MRHGRALGWGLDKKYQMLNVAMNLTLYDTISTWTSKQMKNDTFVCNSFIVINNRIGMSFEFDPVFRKTNIYLWVSFLVTSLACANRKVYLFIDPK